MTLRMRLEYLPAQIVLVGSRHMVVVAESRLFYITLSMISLVELLLLKGWRL
jgi:hypothetical protein